MLSDIQKLEARIKRLENELQQQRDMMGTFGIEGAFKRYYGIYRARVMDNKDPEQRGRILVMCPTTGDTEGNFPQVWVDPAFAGAGTNHGNFFPPEIGDSVRIAYENGHSGKPVIYWGGWYGLDELPAEFKYSADGAPQRRGFVTKAGHSVVVSDEPGKEAIQLTWHKPEEGDPSLTDPEVAADRTKGKFAFLTFDPNGNVLIANQNGSMLSLDATNGQISIIDQHGNSVTTDESGIKLIDKSGNTLALDGDAALLSMKKAITLTGTQVSLKAGGVFIGDKATFSAVLGEQLMQWLAAHTHPTGVGPSGPPVPLPPPSILSTTVKVQK